MILKTLKNFFHQVYGGKTQLMPAVEREDIDVVKKLLRNSDSHTELFRIDKEGRTALFYAAARGDCDIIWELLWRLPGTGIACARGSLLNQEDKHGQLAEDFVEAYGHDKARETLVHERVRIEYYE